MNLTESYLEKCSGIIEKVKSQQQQIKQTAQWFAESILSGTIALNENRNADAITAFKKAVTTDENMVYNEPRDWVLNPKHYLGNAYLEKKDGLNAEKVFRKDLLNNNDNGWALYGLHKALLLQKKSAEAAKVLAKFKVAFNKSDVKITSPVF